jgi:CxxC motif-containing protein (DUF1111 family)
VIDGRPFLLTERNSTALFGAGLINTIPDAALHEAAKWQEQSNSGVSGRVAVAPGGAAGKFGWRGQTATLDDFVRGACAVELGLEVSTHDQALNPLPDKLRAQNPPRQRRSEDLTDRQCDDLAAFVAALPAPSRVPPANFQQAAFLKNGEQLFASVGCAVCHVPALGDVEGLYSDLLLHDMGANLADPVAATPSTRTVRGWDKRGGGYLGGGGPVELLVELPTNVQQEWRTPPLWGVRDSAPYLHDGRAATLAEAIALHGGEAAPSAQRFLSLPADARERLIVFVGTIGGAE